MALAAIAVLGVGAWLIIRPDSKPVELVEAKLGSIAQTVSVTGKVKAAHAVDLAFQASGRVVKVYGNIGDKVKTGDLIVQLDMSDAQKAVRDAKTSLESAELALDKLRGSADAAGDTDQLKKAYAGGFDALTSTYTDSSSILDSLNTILFSTTLDTSPNRKSDIQYYVDIASSYNSSFVAIPRQIKFSYDDTVVLYNQAFADYKAIQGNYDGPAIVKALASSYKAETAISDIIKTATGIIRFVTDSAIQNNWNLNSLSTITTNQSSLTESGTAVSGHITELRNASQTIANYNLDIKSQELVVQQKQNALSDANDNLRDYSIYAPFAGVVTREDAKVGEIAAPNITLVSLISESALEIEANITEADIAKIKLGNHAEVTLDAYNSNFTDVAFTATVTAIDPAEIIIDGVPTYKTTLQFEKLAEGIKPGMTANLDITTAVHDNVIIIPQRAVVRQGDRQFVQMPANNQSQATTEQTVTTGLRSSDGMIEIVSCLKAGDKVILYPVSTP